MHKNPTKKTEPSTDFPLYLYHHGKNDRIYELFGAHKANSDGKDGYVFRVWAPHARSVSVVGDFNGWNAEAAEDLKPDSKALSLDDVKLTSVILSDASPLVGRTPLSAGLRENFDSIVVAVHRGDEFIDSNPDLVFRPGDILWLVGNLKKLNTLK